jgi:hypothetical protein
VGPRDPADHLAILKRRRNRAWVAYCLIVPTFLVARLLPLPGWGRTLLGIALVAAFAIASVAALLSHCPRCAKPFHRKDGRGHTFARRCVHCGLGLDGTTE